AHCGRAHRRAPRARERHADPRSGCAARRARRSPGDASRTRMSDRPSLIVVTGAGRGMGRACAERLLADGHDIVAVDLQSPEIDGTVSVGCDVSDRAGVEQLAAGVAARGTFRGLVHAAGISPTMGEVRQVFAVDLLGTQYLLDAFEPLVEPG